MAPYFLAMLLLCPQFASGGGGGGGGGGGAAQARPSHPGVIQQSLGRKNLLQLRGGLSDEEEVPGPIYPEQVDSDHLDLDSEASAKPDDLLAYHQGDLEPGEADDLLGSEDESCAELVRKEMRRLEEEIQSKQGKPGDGSGGGGGGGAGGNGGEGGGENTGGRESAGEALAGAGSDPGRGGGESRQGAGDRDEESDSLWKKHESSEDQGEDGPYRNLDEVPQANTSLLLEQLTLDGSIQKNQMATSRVEDSAKPERGQEVFFHYRGFCGDAEFADSRRAGELESRPVKMTLTADKARATASSAGSFKMDRPYMGAWEICLRSLSRGEYALFLVKGAQRVGEMLGPDSPCKVPEWVPKDGSVQLRFVIELLNFGFKEVIPGGDILYKCVWDGKGYGSPGSYDEVLISFVAKEQASGVKVATSKGKKWVQLGLGVLPIGVETALTKEFRKGAAGTVILKGRQTLRAGPSECSRALSGLRSMLEGHKEEFNWLAMCGGSLGSLDWEWHNASGKYVWGLEGKLGSSSACDAGGNGEALPCLQCDVELHDWNKIQNMSLPDPRAIGADEYASCGPLIVKNLGYREDEGTEDLQDGDEIEIEFEGGFADLVGPPSGAADHGECLNESERGVADGDEGPPSGAADHGECLNESERGVAGGDEEAVDVGVGDCGITAANASKFKRVVIGNGDLPFALDLGLTRAKSGGQVIVTMLNEGNASWDVYRANVGRIIRTGLDMNWGEKTRLAEKRKEEGNRFFKAGKMREALSKYRFAAIFTRNLNNVQVEEGENEEEDEERGAVCRAMSQLNSAQCLIALGMHSMARDECSLVLDRDPQNVKALFRRSKVIVPLSPCHLPPSPSIYFSPSSLLPLCFPLPPSPSLPFSLSLFLSFSVWVQECEHKRLYRPFEQPCIVTALFHRPLALYLGISVLFVPTRSISCFIPIPLVPLVCSQALLELGEVHDALADLENLLHLDPDNAAASRELALVRRKVQASDAKSAPTFKKMFGAKAPANLGALDSTGKTCPSSAPAQAPVSGNGVGKDDGDGKRASPSGRARLDKEEACGPCPKPSLEEEANAAMTEFERTQDASALE
jgi:tetratricopeptide (TPR) repeat protein